MAFKDVLSLCGRIGLIMAAFAFVAGIVAGPLLEKVWSSRPTTIVPERPGCYPRSAHTPHSGQCRETGLTPF